MADLLELPSNNSPRKWLIIAGKYLKDEIRLADFACFTETCRNDFLSPTFYVSHIIRHTTETAREEMRLLDKNPDDPAFQRELAAHIERALYLRPERDIIHLFVTECEWIIDRAEKLELIKSEDAKNLSDEIQRRIDEDICLSDLDKKVADWFHSVDECCANRLPLMSLAKITANLGSLVKGSIGPINYKNPLPELVGNIPDRATDGHSPSSGAMNDNFPLYEDSERELLLSVRADHFMTSFQMTAKTIAGYAQTRFLYNGVEAAATVIKLMHQLNARQDQLRQG